MVVYMVGSVHNLSTCNTVDLEMVKKKRIEAIRSQILTKLRLQKAPEEAGEKEEIPANLLSLYNSTSEILKEQQVLEEENIPTEQKEEEYFAKVVNRFIMKGEYKITLSSNKSWICESWLNIKKGGNSWWLNYSWMSSNDCYLCYYIYKLRHNSRWTLALHWHFPLWKNSYCPDVTWSAAVNPSTTAILR